ILPIYSSILRRGLLDRWTCAGIFYLTLIRYSFGEIYAQAQAERDQTPGIRAARLAQPTSANGERPALPGKQLLRPTGPGSGQIRDAAPSACRWTISESGLFRLRLFSPLILSSQIGLRAGRIARACATQTRSPSSPQADSRDSGISSQGQDRATGTRRSGAGASARSRVRPEDSSTLHRAWIRAATKKSELTQAAAAAAQCVAPASD